MLYPDTVEAEVLVHKPWFVATMFGVVLLFFMAFDLSGTGFAELMRPVIGEPSTSGL